MIQIGQGSPFPTPPQGRLTLTSGTAIPTSDVAAATTVYYTPAVGRYVPIWNGSTLVMTDTGGEISQATTDTTKSPAAVIGNTCYDYFVWNDAGTIRCTRGPAWSIKQTFTVTIATPAVVTQTGHGLSSGMTWTPTTSGALPTGLTAATDYYVTVIDANTFNVSTTLANQVAGTLVATSGSQSGTHTGENRTLLAARGTGAGTSELLLQNGIYINKNAITNGAGANLGTWVGTIWANGSATVDMKFGTTANGGGAATIGVWNLNRVPINVRVRDNTSTQWTYTSATIRAANASAGNRINFVAGLALDAIDACYNETLTTASAGAFATYGFALNSTTAMDRVGGGGSPSAVGAYVFAPASGKFRPQAGFNYISAVEASDGTHSAVFNSAAGVLQSQGLEATIWA